MAYTHIVYVRSFNRQDLNLKHLLCKSKEEAQEKLVQETNQHVEFLRKFCKDKDLFLDFLHDTEDLYTNEDLALFKTMFEQNLVWEDIKDVPWVFVPCVEAQGYDQPTMGTNLRIEPFTATITDDVYAGEFCS